MLGVLLRSTQRSPKPSLSCTIHSISASKHATAQTPNRNSRQRRHSSSKPSSPPNDSSDTIAATSATKDVSTGTRKRSTIKGSRSRPKDGVTKTTTSGVQSTVPAPSTQHMNIEDVAVASFFSLHRPISVIAPVPPMSTSKTFAAIFSPSSKAHVGDAMFTLSSAVGSPALKALEQQGSNDLRSAVTQASPTDADPVQGDAQSIYINVNELAAKFRPFQPPPPPEFVDDMNGTSQYWNLAQKSMVTSKVLPGSLQKYMADVPFPRARVPFFDRMRIRQLQWIERRSELQRSIWHAISVKRQRKLKMKKHKYKKLMKRTRNLRRKQDRL